MTFQPVIPLGGLPGWTLLNATLSSQQSNFNENPRIIRDTAYFEAKISEVSTAKELVTDRRLLRVALGSFGLLDDLDSRAFVQKILEGGSENDSALANRLTDDRYRQFAKAYGFGNLGGARTGDPGFGRNMADQFRDRQFEIAVGEQDQALRLAMNAQRALPELVQSGSETTKWLRILGDPPLRKLFETALGLPTSFGQVDLDRQIAEFGDRAARQLNIKGPSDFADPDVMDRIVQRFLLRDQIANTSNQVATSVALTLLQASTRAF